MQSRELKYAYESDPTSMIQIPSFSAHVLLFVRYREIKNRGPQTPPFGSLYTPEHGGTVFSCFGSRNRVSLSIYLPHLTRIQYLRADYDRIDTIRSAMHELHE